MYMSVGVLGCTVEPLVASIYNLAVKAADPIFGIPVC